MVWVGGMRLWLMVVCWLKWVLFDVVYYFVVCKIVLVIYVFCCWYWLLIL